MNLHLFARLAVDDWLIRCAAQRRTALVHTTTYTQGTLVGYDRKRRQLRIRTNGHTRSYRPNNLVAIR